MKEIYFKIGASLYTPATHKSLLKSLENGIAGERSMIVCTEDAVSHEDLPMALDALKIALAKFEPSKKYRGCRFIRPRNPDIFSEIINMEGIEKIDGFVLPKANVDSLDKYIEVLKSYKEKMFDLGRPAKLFMLMPTLETPEVMTRTGLEEIRLKLEEIKSQIVCLRLGGNDLMGILGIKRMPGLTIYETPIRSIIDMIVTEFRPHGFEISAPVFDYIDDRSTLYREMEQDLNYGFFAKTAIHPSQIPVMDSAYREYLDNNSQKAASLLSNEKAVYQNDGQMMEKTCHFNWAMRTVIFHKESSLFYGESMKNKEESKTNLK